MFYSNYSLIFWNLETFMICYSLAEDHKITKTKNVEDKSLVPLANASPKM